LQARHKVEPTNHISISLRHDYPSANTITRSA